MSGASASQLIDEVVRWAREQADILGVLLVGSYARGAAKEGSDVDLMLFTSGGFDRLKDDAWIQLFGQVNRVVSEDWNVVKTLRVFYEGGLVAEFNFATLARLMDAL